MRTAASAAAVRAATSARASPRLRGPKPTSSATVVMNSWSSGSWNTSPTRARSSRERVAAHRQPGDLELARAAQQPVEVQHQGRLAGAVRAEHGDALAVRDVEVEPVEHVAPAA